MEQKTKNTIRNVAAGILIAAGSFSLLGSAGTEDYRDEINYANEQAGYEKYSDEDIASQKTTKTLAWTGILELGGAALLLMRRKQENTK